MDRACVRHSWLALNGRSRSDSHGAYTCVHKDRRTVIDLALVPRVARADLRVVPISRADWGHRALLVSVWADSPVSPVSAGRTDVVERPVGVKLSASAQRAFAETDWGPLQGQLVAAAEAATPGVPASEALLDQLEEGILARLTTVSGRTVTVHGVGRSRKGRAGGRVVSVE